MTSLSTFLNLLLYAGFANRTRAEMPQWFLHIITFLVMGSGISTPVWAMRAASHEACSALLITTQAQLNPEQIAESTRESIDSLIKFRLKNLNPFETTTAENPTDHIFVDDQSKPTQKKTAAVNSRELENIYLQQVLSPSPEIDLMGLSVRGDSAIRQFLEEYGQNLEAITAGTNQFSRSFREQNKVNYRLSSAIVAAVFLNFAYYMLTGDNDHILAKPIYLTALASGFLGYLPVTFSVDGQVWLLRFVESEKSKLNRLFDVLNSKDKSRWVFASRATRVPSTFPKTPSLRPDLIEPLAVPIASDRLGIPQRGHHWAVLRVDQALYFEENKPGQIEPVLNIIVRVYNPQSPKL